MCRAVAPFIPSVLGSSAPLRLSGGCQPGRTGWEQWVPGPACGDASCPIRFLSASSKFEPEDFGRENGWFVFNSPQSQSVESLCVSVSTFSTITVLQCREML